jgi:hypothetical protein
VIIGDKVIHLPHGCNWLFEGATKNPRSGNRKVVLLEIYNQGSCAVVTPIKGNGAGERYVCNLSELSA